MSWLFALFMWTACTIIFYAVGVSIFHGMGRRFPLRLYEVAYCMAVTIGVIWLALQAVVYSRYLFI